VHVAFLRNVMVGRAGLTQEALVCAFRDCGASSVESFLATGNVVFDSDAASARSIADCAAIRLEDAVGLREPVFVRSLEHLQALQASAPFSVAPVGDIHERTVTFFDELVRPLPGLPLRSKRGDCQVFMAGDREAFAVTWLIDGRTGNPGKLIEDLGSTRVTTRNWKTIERLLRRYGADASV
jgi:uncharacterized protein (DUF1697 family)